MKAEAKREENKIKVSGLVYAFTWTTLHEHDQAYVHSLDHTHMGFCPKTLETQKTKQDQNINSSNLTCFKT